MSRAGDVLRLQQLDTEVSRVSSRLQEAEAAIAGDPELRRRRRVAAAAHAQRVAADDVVSIAEREVAGLRKRSVDLERHLYDGSVRNPQELLGMQHELEALRSRISAEEDRLLGLMESAEQAATEERETNARVVAREQQRADSAGSLLEEAVVLRQMLEQTTGERDQLGATLTPSDTVLYTRLRNRLPDAVVRLQGDSCGGCHLPFAINEVHRIRSGNELVQCPNCDRIVVA